MLNSMVAVTQARPVFKLCGQSVMIERVEGGIGLCRGYCWTRFAELDIQADIISFKINIFDYIVQYVYSFV